MVAVLQSVRPLWWFEPADMEDGTFHAQSLAWVRSLGLDPDKLSMKAVVVTHNGRYELHVEEWVCDEDGGPRLDPFDDKEFLTVRRIVILPEPNWPPRPPRD